VTKTANPTAVPETGGNVTFTFVVKNTSSEEPVTITSLTDSVYGTLAGDDDCKVGTVLAAGASCTFSITKFIGGVYPGPDHVNVFKAKAVDNDKTEATDTDDATVTFTDANQPSIAINSLSISVNSGKTTATGRFSITDESSSGTKPDGFLITLWNYGVDWELLKSGKRQTWQLLTASCTYTIVSRDGTTYSTPLSLATGDTVTFDESVTLGYSCTFDPQISKGTLRGTAYAEIYGRDNRFTFSSTATLR
jgi:hypothetical protein